MVTQATQPKPAQNNVDLDGMLSMEALLSGGTEAKEVNFVEGTIIQGIVAEKRDNELLLDIGYKAEGRVSREEIRDWDKIVVGQTIDVFLEQVEDEDNMPVLSVRRAEVQRAWDRIVDENAEGTNIRGLVKSRVKGGLIVDVGVDAFLPGSQVDLGPVRNLEDYLGQEFDFRILKISVRGANRQYGVETLHVIAVANITSKMAGEDKSWSTREETFYKVSRTY